MTKWRTYINPMRTDGLFLGEQIEGAGDTITDFNRLDMPHGKFWCLISQLDPSLARSLRDQHNSDVTALQAVIDRQRALLHDMETSEISSVIQDNFSLKENLAAVLAKHAEQAEEIRQLRAMLPEPELD